MSEKIVLFRPLPNQEKRPIVSAPLSLLTAASLLDRDGFTVKIIDALVEPDYAAQLLRHADGALCVGITAMTGYQIHDGLAVSAQVKKRFPRLPVIWGGWHPTIMPEQTVSHPCVDIVVKGQGEITFQQTVQALKDAQSLEGIAGIVYKQGERIMRNPDRPIEDLNRFPPIPYHLIDVEKYIHLSDMGYRTLDYRITQGCPFQCSFCAEHLMSKRRWVALSSQRMYEEFKYLKDTYRIDSIMLLEDSTFVERNRIKEFCRLLIDQNLAIRWGNANVRANQLLEDEEIWDLLQRSGCHNLLVGAESGLQDILDLVNKQVKVQDIVTFKRKCSQYGLRSFVSFMIGFPSQRIDRPALRRELDSILEVIDQLRSIDWRQQIYVSIYMPYPGTPLFALALQCGMREPASLEEWAAIDLTGSHSPWLPKGFAGRINYLNEFIFPYASDVLGRDWEKFISHRRFPRLFRLAKVILAAVARWRLRHRFFLFPIEGWLLKMVRRTP